MTVLLALVFGLLAGMITTVAGLGGGMVLVAVLALVIEPVTALSATAVGLLVGNLHRAWMYREELAWRAALPMVAGAAPGAFLAGLVIAWLPTWALFAVMVAMATLAIARQAGWGRVQPPAWAGVPVGVLTGVVTATSGGGGLLVSPWLLARGLVGAAYVGTVGIIAVSLHTARIAAYGWSGATDLQALGLGALLAVCLPLGNLLGHRIRDGLDLPVQARVQVAVLLLSLGLAGLGLAQDLLATPVAEAAAAVR